MNPDPQVAYLAVGVVALLGGLWAIARGLRTDVREIVRDEVAPMRETQKIHGDEIRDLRCAKSDAFQRIARLEASP